MGQIDIDTRIVDFYQRNSGKYLDIPWQVEPINRTGRIQPSPYTPWYPLELTHFPLAQVLEEAKSLDSAFVAHRPHEGHKGWMALTLHGIAQDFTQVYHATGSEQVSYDWTEIASKCPVTVAYFKKIFPAVRYERIRFMKVSAGGYVLPHRDKEEPGFGPLAIPLNVPTGCHYILEPFGLIPVEAGKGLLVDISHTHAIWNQSTEDRYHLHIEKDCGTRYPEYRDLFRQTAELLRKKHRPSETLD
jgi:hypothetical protein